MRLCKQLCTPITIAHRRYQLRLTHDRVLFALEAVKDPLLTDADKLRLVLRLLLRGRVPLSVRRQTELLEGITAEINQHNREYDGPPLMSLTQDAPLIRAAFQQAYGIDLHLTSLPWAMFCELLSGLPKDTRFCEVVEIRTRPIPPPDGRNAGYIETLMKAKFAVALKLTSAQLEESFQTGLNRFARSLMAWAEQNGERRNDA